MGDKILTITSRRLSYGLRHNPEEVFGTSVSREGYVDVGVVLRSLNLTKDQLDKVVSTNSKNRFSYSEDGTQLRANQGHTITVELNLKEVEIPPSYLYHGTSKLVKESILSNGIERMKRHHVHLSPNKSVAFEVGKRHGSSIVVFKINTRVIQSMGISIYLSENGVYLVDHVPIEALEIEYED